MHNFRVILCLGVALTTAVAMAQVQSQTNPEAKSGAPVAYVYVSAGTGNGNPNSIVGYSVAANGSLSPILGSPFSGNVYSMAVNGKYLMAVENADQPNIDTFEVGSNGALTYVTSTSCVQTGNQCIVAGNLFFDHTGSDLYVMEEDSDTNDETASYAVDKSSGVLNYLGNTITGAFPGDYSGTFFIGDNVYAYSADQSGCMYPGVYGFQRESSGLLKSISTQYNQPTPPPGVRIYYPDLTVADPNNNLAFLEQPANPPGCAAGPLQIAVYTVDGQTATSVRTAPIAICRRPRSSTLPAKLWRIDSLLVVNKRSRGLLRLCPEGTSVNNVAEISAEAKSSELRIFALSDPPIVAQERATIVNPLTVVPKSYLCNR